MGYFRYIPEHIAQDHSLTDGEKMCYGVIWGLCEKRGVCWASNEYIAKELGKKKRQVQRYLEKFQKNKLIIVEIEGNRDRKIWTPETFSQKERIERIFEKEPIKENIKGVMDDMGGCHQRHGGVSSKTPYNIAYNIKTKKEKILLKQDTKESPPSLSFGKFVKLPDDSHKKLIDRFGSDLVKDVIEDMNDYCENNRPKGYSNYESSIRNWCKKRVAEGKKPKSILKETKRDEIARRLNEEYVQHNGSFNDNPNILKFS